MGFLLCFVCLVDVMVCRFVLGFGLGLFSCCWLGFLVFSFVCLCLGFFVWVAWFCCLLGFGFWCFGWAFFLILFIGCFAWWGTGFWCWWFWAVLCLGVFCEVRLLGFLFFVCCLRFGVVFLWWGVFLGGCFSWVFLGGGCLVLYGFFLMVVG